MKSSCHRITCKGYERRKVSMKVKRGLKNSIHLPNFMYRSGNKVLQSRVCAVEMSYLRVAFGGRVIKACMKDVERELVKGVKDDVVEWFKRNTLMWFGHMVKMNSEVCGKKK